MKQDKIKIKNYEGKVLIVTFLLLVISLTGCVKYNPSTHECNEWKCQRCTPSLFGVECKPTKKDIEVCGGYEGTNLGKWKAVCVNYEKIDWKDKQIDDLNLKINKYLLEDYQWYCIEWANKTEINPVWVDNCCIGTDVSLSDGNSEYHSLGICFDTGPEIQDKNGSVFSSISMGNQSIDMEFCHITPREISTNESICIVQKRKGW